ncbi:MAG: hypothetical protein IJZ34_12210 [Lachnospiraceae bacterium]|nr:hypothetical protein [Lachnospiraceae bacterium]
MLKKINNYDLCVCDMSGNVFKLSVERGYDSRKFIETLMNSDLGQMLYKKNILGEWLSDTFVMEGIENELHPIQGEVYNEEFMYWIGYLFKYWGIIYENETAKDMITQAPIDTLLASYIGLHVMFFDDVILELKSIYEEKKENRR